MELSTKTELPTAIKFNATVGNELWLQDEESGQMLAELVRDEDDPQTDEEYFAFAHAIRDRHNSHDALVEALRGLFDNCAMIHKHWGDGCNQKESDAAIERARALLSQLEGLA